MAAPGISASAAPTETVLHSFTGSDGASPVAGLIADGAGNLYGTTQGGGAADGGVVFKLSPSGTETVLHSFTGSDGALPFAGLIADSAGNLYGTTQFGGALGQGAVFKLSPGGTETVLHSFTGSDGANPLAGLITDSAGNLYSTTENGGASNRGAVFKLSPSGTETVLYSFTGGSDGAFPLASLIADSAGNLYGTTRLGGASGGGVVLKLSLGGAETVLYSFTGGSDGSQPFDGLGLIADSAGNLYGTTLSGGASGNGGTVFKLAGTGFVTAVPFSAFKAILGIQFGKNPNTDAFELLSEFTLGHSSNGINPPAEPVTLNVGTFTTTIPPGSFKGSGFGPFYFVGAVNGVNLQVGIAPTGAKRYAFAAAAQKASLTGTANPVSVTVTIGDDTGTVSVNARIDH